MEIWGGKPINILKNQHSSAHCVNSVWFHNATNSSNLWTHYVSNARLRTSNKKERQEHKIKDMKTLNLIT